MAGQQKWELIDDLIHIYEKVPYTVRKDSLDDLLFSRHKDRLTEKVKEKVKEQIPQLPPLVSDTFNVFYKLRPQFLDESQIVPEFLVNKRVLEKVMNTDTFNELKSTTTLDDVNSAIATVILTENLYKELKTKLKEIKEHTEQIQQLRNQLQNACNKGTCNRQLADQVAQQMQQHANAMQNLVTQGAVSVAVRKAKREHEDVQNAMAALGFGNEPGRPLKVDPEKAIKLASELKHNHQLMEMTKLLGRMRNLLRSTSKAKPKKSNLELHNISMGRDLERMLPSELLKLRKCRRIFFMDYYEGKLLHYNIKRREKEAKGPIVMAVDMSGSMRGEREQWAKAVSLATIDIAVKEKRSWAFVAFDKRIKAVKVFVKPPAPEDVLEIMKIGANGGTDYELPLKEAMKIIEQEKDFTRADILFISDGECALSEEFLRSFDEFKKRKNVHVIGTLISGRPKVMKEFCGEVLALNGCIDTKAAEAIFQKIV